MHHYPFHPGDYMLATAHLTLEEDATYRRALDHYYDTEAPLAFDKQTLSKRLRVSEQTLSNVLAEFFIETPEGWRHKRCDAEIARYKAKSEKAKRAGSLGGLAKSSGRQANAKRTPSKRLANQELEPRTKNQDIIPPAPPAGGGKDEAPKAQATPDPRHSAFIHAYAEAYEHETGSKYVFQTRDTKTLQTFLGRSPATVEQMMTLARWAWERAKQPFAAKRHSAATIHDFLTDWQTLVMDRRQPQGAAPNRHAAYTPEGAMAKLKPGQSPQDF